MYNVFNNQTVNVRWWMTRLRLGLLVMLLNILLYWLFAPLVREQPYGDGSNVGVWSALAVPIFGTVAFRRHDGTLMFRW